MVVEKAVKMAQMCDVPILGIVENMSYFQCDDCGKKHFIFGHSRLEEIAERHGIANVARLPIDPAIARSCDEGRIESVASPWLDDIVETIRAL